MELLVSNPGHNCHQASIHPCIQSTSTTGASILQDARLYHRRRDPREDEGDDDEPVHEFGDEGKGHYRHEHGDEDAVRYVGWQVWPGVSQDALPGTSPDNYLGRPLFDMGRDGRGG